VAIAQGLSQGLQDPIVILHKQNPHDLCSILWARSP